MDYDAIVKTCEMFLSKLTDTDKRTVEYSTSFFGAIHPNGDSLHFPQSWACTARWRSFPECYLFYSVARSYEEFKPFYDWLFTESFFADCFDARFVDKEFNMVIVKPLPHAYLATICMRIWEYKPQALTMMRLSKLGYPMLLAKYLGYCFDYDKSSRSYQLRRVGMNTNHTWPPIGSIGTDKDIAICLGKDVPEIDTDLNGFYNSDSLFRGVSRKTLHARVTDLARQVADEKKVEIPLSFALKAYKSLTKTDKLELVFNKSQMKQLLTKIEEIVQ